MHTAADAEIIGIIDADYVVTAGLAASDLVPLFDDARVGLVQAPQDHRDGDRSIMHHAMNGEYAGFFDIGMVQRNEHNAIVVHGTMCLVRRAALEAAGGWSSDTICEDTDLGLTLLEQGWLAHYTNKRYGHGLLPDTYDAFKKQRDRWAYGGLQILKKHWRRFLPGASRLTRDQKREFALGWLNWLGAESVGVVVAILNIVWVPVIAFLDIAVPDRILTVPIIASFVVSMAHFVTLYRLRVQTGKGQMVDRRDCRHVGAMDGGARGRASAWSRTTCPSCAPPKAAPAGRRRTDFHAFWEAILAGLLIARRRRAGRDQHQGSARDQYLRRRAVDPEPALHRRRGHRACSSARASTTSPPGARSMPSLGELVGRRARIAKAVAAHASAGRGADVDAAAARIGAVMINRRWRRYAGSAVSTSFTQ